MLIHCCLFDQYCFPKINLHLPWHIILFTCCWIQFENIFFLLKILVSISIQIILIQYLSYQRFLQLIFVLGWQWPPKIQYVAFLSHIFESSHPRFNINFSVNIQYIFQCSLMVLSFSRQEFLKTKRLIQLIYFQICHDFCILESVLIAFLCVFFQEFFMFFLDNQLILSIGIHLSSFL